MAAASADMFHQEQKLKRPISSLSAYDNHAASLFDDFDNGIDDMHSRRQSVAASSTPAPLFSPAQSHHHYWEDDFTVAVAGSSHFNLPQHSNNPFRMNPFAQPNPQCSFYEQSADASIAPATYEPYSNEFGAIAPSHFQGATTDNPFSPLAPQINVRPAAIFPAAAQPVTSSIMSPVSGKGWMIAAEQSSEPRHISKRLRQNSPPRGFSPFGKRPGDGIRKKLARVDIPPERNLVNIDQLIANSNNEDEVKELKCQKRLLRNRQAALDSRQRKKKQYEEAQEEKKLSNDRVAFLDDRLEDLTSQLAEKVDHCNELWARNHVLENDVNDLRTLNDQIMSQKTIETGELRQKVIILTERLKEAQAALDMKHPAAAGADLNEFTNDMNDLSMGNDWEGDEYAFIDNFSFEHDGKPVVASRPIATEEDRPMAASGLLVMLLLCGAWVASKSTGTAAPNIPRMPEEVRAASAVVLDSVFKDAGVAPSQSFPLASTFTLHGTEPMSSGSAWPQPNSGMSSAQQNMPSTFNPFNYALTQPTKEQEAEQAFSLSTSQYISLTTGQDSDGFSSSSTFPTGTQFRRNLAQSLKAMREGAKSGATDTFTRSLLWDRVPTDVVKEFKRMVEASDGG